MNSIRFTGCSTTPIGSYLKALGILRLVGEQLDPDARGYWVGDTFRLDTVATRDEIVDFFDHRYAPTPLVSPWNGGSGFAPGDKAAIKAIQAILACSDRRFAIYQATLKSAQDLVESPAWALEGKDQKQRRIALCRSSFPDPAVDWLDASVVIANDRMVFPPLFGTGGNDGRLEFSSNFMQRLVALLIEPPKRGAPTSAALVADALFGGSTSALVSGTAGQYDPNSVNPKVTTSSGSDSSLANPWDYLLLIEGGLVFASGASRRFGTASTIRAAVPFTVDSSPVGYGNASSDEDSRGEVWTPVWTRPATITEVTRLSGEGRAQWGRSPAANGVDFAKAAATLGVDRGIDRFVRHSIVQRYGKSFLAVPVGQVTVGSRPEVNVLLTVDRWLQHLPRQLPASARSARRRVDAAEFRAASGMGRSSSRDLQQVLIELATLELALGRSSKVRENTKPVGGLFSRLPAGEWLPVLDDGSVELRLAASLASARDRYPSGVVTRAFQTVSSVGLLIRPVELDARGNLDWSSGPARVPGIGHRFIDKVLADVLVERSIRLQQAGSADDKPGDGIEVAFDFGMPASLADLGALSEGRVDTARLASLAHALTLLDWRQRDASSAPAGRLLRPAADSGDRVRVTSAMAAILPFFHGRAVHVANADGVPTETTLRPGAAWPRLLAARRLVDLGDDALRRYRMNGLRPGPRTIRPTPPERDGALSVAALCRLATGDVRDLMQQTCPTINAVTSTRVFSNTNQEETS